MIFITLFLQYTAIGTVLPLKKKIGICLCLEVTNATYAVTIQARKQERFAISDLIKAGF